MEFPEAIEAILINGSRVEPKVAILKPISSAISIGSGGPFGAEGPIIMTGGAFGSSCGGNVGDLRRTGGFGAAGRGAAAV
jgi:H+/Cl- antiporter ClcA